MSEDDLQVRECLDLVIEQLKASRYSNSRDGKRLLKYATRWRERFNKREEILRIDDQRVSNDTGITISLGEMLAGGLLCVIPNSSAQSVGGQMVAHGIVALAKPEIAQESLSN